MGKPLMRGRRFGRLVVGNHVGYDGAWRTYECRCDCGSTIVTSSKLLCAHKKSCGCLLNESRSSIGKRNFIDITGRRSGMLVAVRVADHRDNRGRHLWLCRCDCGQDAIVRPSQITGCTLISCGCAHGSGVALRPPDIRARDNAYRTHRRRTNLHYALSIRMSSRMGDSLRRGKSGRRWEGLVGYTTVALKDHLQKTMPPGFTWDDFLAGRLHIDHVIPLAVHNYRTADDEDFKKAWALTNLQLLPARENMQKHDKIARPFQPSFAWSNPAPKPRHKPIFDLEPETLKMTRRG